MRKDLVDSQVELNSNSSSLSETYKNHRDTVMQLLAATVKDLTQNAQGRCSSVVLLGAGNCLDVDLTALAGLFECIHLVDVDSSALQSVAEKHEDLLQSTPARLVVHSPVDIAEPLLSLTSRDFEPTPDNQDHCIKVLQHLSSDKPKVKIPKADVVVSLCLLSQLAGSLSKVISESHPAFSNALKAIRVGHLRRMMNLLHPGGVAILISDVVSSDTAPQLAETPPAELPQLITRLVSERNFFSGTNPSLVINELNILSRLPGGPDLVHTIDPWLWQLGNRTYAVYAMRFQKKTPLA